MHAINTKKKKNLVDTSLVPMEGIGMVT